MPPVLPKAKVLLGGKDDDADHTVMSAIYIAATVIFWINQ